MKSGSREIQQRMKQQVPRLDEPMKVWVQKAAKFYGCTYTKLENLYYRPGHSIPNDIYLKLTALSKPTRFNPEAKHPHLNELISKLDTQQKEISRLGYELQKERETRKRAAQLLFSQ